ncbi:MAG: phenylalanine--tRNA ligase subunit beta [Ignisphaera sp.]
MPVVRARIGLLMEMTEISDVDKLRDILFRLKCETEVEDRDIAVEVQSDRIDMFSVEGIAKAVRMYMGLDRYSEPSLRNFPFRVFVEPPAKRPYIAVAAVTNVKLNEERLKLLIEFQERLHTTFGRGRKKVAIGLHDLDKLPSTILVYKDVDIDKTTMIPLHDYREFRIRDVLSQTDQGKLYGSISLNGSLHPAILSNEKVISLPPVINSDITRLTENSKNILIDVTGTDLDSVNNVLNTIVHSLTFYGGEVLGAIIRYPDKEIVTPNISPRTMELNLGFISTWLGIDASKDVEVVKRALERMGYNVDSVGSNRMTITIPYYRIDVLHPVDVVEDIVIGIGYEELGFVEVEPRPIVRRGVDQRDVANIIRDVLIGLGFIELNTLTLIPQYIAEILELKNTPIVVNAPSNEINALRTTLAESIINILKNSQYVPQPVKVFEIGEVVTECSECYNRWKNDLRACWAIMDSETRFEEMHATLYAIARELELDKMLVLKPCSSNMFMRGRCADVYVGNKLVGFLGEVDPEKLEKLEILYPITLAEVSINILYTLLVGK